MNIRRTFDFRFSFQLPSFGAPTTPDVWGKARARNCTRALVLSVALLGIGAGLLPGTRPARAVETAAATSTAAKTVTPVVLGNPFLGKKHVYARNVWDMQAFGGKIYLGHGDSAANSGNTPIFSLDPRSGKFTNELTTNSEQIDEFFPIDGALYTLNHDPTGAKGYDISASIYKQSGAGWSRLALLPGMVHSYSIARQNGVWYLGGGTATADCVYRSPDAAKWSGALTGEWSMKLNGTLYTYTGNRAYLLLPVGGQLYAVQSWRASKNTSNTGFYRLNEASGTIRELRGDRPDAQRGRGHKRRGGALQARGFAR